MDGAKVPAETSGPCLNGKGGRGVSREGRSPCLSKGGPRERKNPGDSSSKVQREPAPPEGLGFLTNVDQVRVSRS